MIIVAGEFNVDPSMRDEYIASREEGMRVSRAEKGCIAYVFSADPLESGKVYLYERWETKEDLVAHLAERRSRPQKDRTDLVISSEVLQYEVSASGAPGS